MKSICKNGANRMPRILGRAPGDIRSRLWTLYWLGRQYARDGIVELGVREGDSTRALLAACEDENCSMVSYDIENVGEHVKNISQSLGFDRSWLDARWAFYCKDSVKAGLEMEATALGLVFIDTDHTYETTRNEIKVWSEFVRPGGCIAFHDYWLRDAPRDGVKPAVDEFANSNPDTWELETYDAGHEGDTGFAILKRL